MAQEKQKAQIKFGARYLLNAYVASAGSTMGMRGKPYTGEDFDPHWDGNSIQTTKTSGSRSGRWLWKITIIAVFSVMAIAVITAISVVAVEVFLGDQIIGDPNHFFPWVYFGGFFIGFLLVPLHCYLRRTRYARAYDRNAYCHVAVVIKDRDCSLRGYSLQTAKDLDGMQIISINEQTADQNFFTATGDVADSYKWKPVEGLPEDFKVEKTHHEIEAYAKTWNNRRYDLANYNCATFAVDVARFALGLPSVASEPESHLASRQAPALEEMPPSAV